jgi:hypothetical protein
MMKIIGKIIAVILLCIGLVPRIAPEFHKNIIYLSKDKGGAAKTSLLSDLSSRESATIHYDCIDKKPWTVEIVDDKTDKLLKRVIFKCETSLNSLEHDPTVTYTIYAFKGDVSKQSGYKKDTPWIKNKLSGEEGYFTPLTIFSANFGDLRSLNLTQAGKIIESRDKRCS